MAALQLGRALTVLASCGFWIFGVAHAASIHVARQSLTVPTADDFLRRAFHSSVVAGKWVYIDGGEYSTASSGLQYSPSVISIDLSRDWTNSTVRFRSSTKPSDVPILVDGGLWYDDSQGIIYSGFSGRVSTISTANNLSAFPVGIWSLKPDGSGGGQWDVALSTKDTTWTDKTRPQNALIGFGGGFGYALGGWESAQTSPELSSLNTDISGTPGLLEFDPKAKRLSNFTVTARFKGDISEGAMHYVSNYGQNGLFVVLGGNQISGDRTEQPGHHLLDFNTVSVFNPATGKWYDQKTTGDIPTVRQGHCVTGMASTDGTYEIFMYGGFGGQFGSSALQYDEMYILTLPAFRWIRIKYSPTSPRYGLTCHAVGGSQILVIGGLDLTSADFTTQGTVYEAPFRRKDPFTQGLGVFDLTTLQFVDEYIANAPAYQQSELVKSYYKAGNATFDSTALAELFAISRFSTTPTNQFSPEQSGSTTKSKHVPAATIAGAVIGTVIGLALLVLLYIFLTRKRTAKPAESSGDPTTTTAAATGVAAISPLSPSSPSSPAGSLQQIHQLESPLDTPVYSIPSAFPEAHEIHSDAKWIHEAAEGDAKWALHEAPGDHQALYEAPANERRVYEMPAGEIKSQAPLFQDRRWYRMGRRNSSQINPSIQGDSYELR